MKNKEGNESVINYYQLKLKATEGENNLPPKTAKELGGE